MAENEIDLCFKATMQEVGKPLRFAIYTCSGTARISLARLLGGVSCEGTKPILSRGLKPLLCVKPNAQVSALLQHRKRDEEDDATLQAK